jgi:hypothetical protein
MSTGLLILLKTLASAEKIVFDTCTDTDSVGVVSGVDITPCERSSIDEPCRFRFGHDYNITSVYDPRSFFSHRLITCDFSIPVDYTSLEASTDKPRASLEARDDTQDPPFEYAYSGQAFDGELEFPYIDDILADLSLRKPANIRSAPL